MTDETNLINVEGEADIHPGYLSLYVVGPKTVTATDINAILKKVEMIKIKYPCDGKRISLYTNAEEKDLGEAIHEYCRTHGYLHRVFEADFKRHAKKAYLKRHTKIMNLSSHVLLAIKDRETITQSRIMKEAEDCAKFLFILKFKVEDGDGEK